MISKCGVYIIFKMRLIFEGGLYLIKLVSTFRRALDDLVEEFIDDSVYNCACVIVRFSDDFL